MALMSMTGFARDDGSADGISWHWELKTVNGRNLDIRCRLAPGFEALEPELRKLISSRIRRGSCQVNLSIRTEADESLLEVNQAALDKLVAVAEELSKNGSLAPARIDGLLGLRGVLQTADIGLNARDGGNGIEPALLASFEAALDSLVTARAAEGEKLQKVIAAQLADTAQLSKAARDCPARSTEAIKQRLQEQVAKLSEADSQLDETRLHQEAVLLAARADIQEELDRLFAHLEAADALLKQSGPVGRKLDFLVQEFNREANTLCAKSNHAALSAIGLDLKGVIDQIKEQVQNIE